MLSIFPLSSFLSINTHKHPCTQAHSPLHLHVFVSASNILIHHFSLRPHLLKLNLGPHLHLEIERFHYSLFFYHPGLNPVLDSWNSNSFNRHKLKGYCPSKHVTQWIVSVPWYRRSTPALSLGWLPACCSLPIVLRWEYCTEHDWAALPLWFLRNIFLRLTKDTRASVDKSTNVVQH